MTSEVKPVASEVKESKPVETKSSSNKIADGEIKSVPLIAVAEKHDTPKVTETEKPKKEAVEAAEKPLLLHQRQKRRKQVPPLVKLVRQALQSQQ